MVYVSTFLVGFCQSSAISIVRALEFSCGRNSHTNISDKASHVPFCSMGNLSNHGKVLPSSNSRNNLTHHSYVWAPMIPNMHAFLKSFKKASRSSFRPPLDKLCSPFANFSFMMNQQISYQLLTITIFLPLDYILILFFFQKNFIPYVTKT